MTLTDIGVATFLNAFHAQIMPMKLARDALKPIRKLIGPPYIRLARTDFKTTIINVSLWEKRYTPTKMMMFASPIFVVGRKGKASCEM